MRRSFLFCLPVFALIVAGRADAAPIVFETRSTATQTVSLFNPADPASRDVVASFPLTAAGSQTFTIDPVAGTANVVSLFQGNDLPNIFGAGPAFLAYELYNTVTTATAAETSPGLYDVALSILFELRITSPGFGGLTLETREPSVFAASGVTLPFGAGTAFFDPIPPDFTDIFIKGGPQGVPAIGTSSDRVVTVDSVVPEPGTLALLGLGAFGFVGTVVRNRARRTVDAKV